MSGIIGNSRIDDEFFTRVYRKTAALYPDSIFIIISSTRYLLIFNSINTTGIICTCDVHINRPAEKISKINYIQQTSGKAVVLYPDFSGRSNSINTYFHHFSIRNAAIFISQVISDITRSFYI